MRQALLNSGEEDFADEAFSRDPAEEALPAGDSLPKTSCMVSEARKRIQISRLRIAESQRAVQYVQDDLHREWMER